MNKTPEELAEKYANSVEASCCGTSDIIIEAEKSFLAGYQAAKDEYEAKLKEVSTNWTFCCEDKARLLQEIAVAQIMPVTIFPTSGQWISVKDRLPDSWDEYLVNIRNHRCELATFTDFINSWCLTGSDAAGLEDDITHWMPLPKPLEE